MKFQFSSSSKLASSAKGTNAETTIDSTQDTKYANEASSSIAGASVTTNATGLSMISSNDDIITEGDAQIGLRGGDGSGGSVSSTYCTVM